MRRRSGLRSQPSTLERRIRLIVGLLRAVCDLGTRSGLGRGHGISGIMGGTEGWPSCHGRADQEQGVSLHPRNRCGATGHAVHADRAIPGPHWTGSRPSIGHDVHVCGFPYPSQNQWLGLFHCRGLEQRSPICFYREQKLPASSFQGDPTGGSSVGLASARERTSRGRSLLNHVSPCENEPVHVAPDPGSHENYWAWGGN